MGKCCSLFVTVMLLLTFIVGVGRSFSGNEVINVPYSTNIPRIDGNWTTPTEWQDASENIVNSFGTENSTMYLRIKHNSTYIFVLMDFVTDRSNSSTDNAWIYFDTKDDGGDSPRVDDYRFDTTRFWQGSGNATAGGNWEPASPPEGYVMEKSFSNLNDPYENDTPHEIYEFRVPCALLGAGYSYGFYCAVQETTFATPLVWPSPSDPNTPTDWGDISSTVQFAPEWSPITAVALFSALTVLTGILYKRRRASIR